MDSQIRGVISRSSRQQSAMEFITTYGWSILIIAIVLGLLYALGVFFVGSSPGAGSCVAVKGFQCAGGSLNSGGALSFTIAYAGAAPIQIAAIGCSNSTAEPTMGWSSIAVNSSILKPGQSEAVIAPCNLGGSTSIGTQFTGTVWIQYYTACCGVLAQEVGIVNYAVTSAAPFTVPTTLKVQQWPAHIAYNPSNGYIYVTSAAYNTVNVISGSTIMSTFLVNSATGMAYNPINGHMYVLDSNGASILSGNTIIATITGIPVPWTIAYSPNNGYMYVTSPAYDTVSVISGTTVIATIPGFYAPYDMAYDPGNGYLYVTNYGDLGDGTTVNVISGTTVIATIPVAPPATSLAYDPSDGYIYVTDYFSNKVSVISGTTVITTISTSIPSGIAYDPSNGYIYVTNYFSKTVSVFSGTTLVTTYPVGINPYEIAYNPSNGYMYVLNADGTISILP